MEPRNFLRSFPQAKSKFLIEYTYYRPSLRHIVHGNSFRCVLPAGADGDDVVGHEDEFD